MAHHCQNLAIQKPRGLSRKAQGGKHPQGIKKAGVKRPVRRSKRLNPELDGYLEQRCFFPADKTLSNEIQFPTSHGKSRKRSREIEDITKAVSVGPLRKRPKKSLSFDVKQRTDPTATTCNKTLTDPIEYWLKEQKWPREYFERGTMEHLLARKRSTPSLRRKRSDPGSASSATPSDQKPREEKSAVYHDPRYRTLLETKSSYMDRSDLDVTDASKKLCRTLLEKEQTVPKDTLFRDDIFDKACRKLQDKNEARVIQDIARLIVPSAETLATFGAKDLEVLVESVNEGWNNSIPLLGSRPQPDYAVGFKRTAFTDEQLTKIDPFVGDIVTDMSYFMATYYMYFLFLTCEVKCGAAALDVADRQNTHSMTLAVRAVVELFRLAKREKEVHREILAFSISHDHRTVRIYGHYPTIDGKNIKYYRHSIHTFDFTALEGKDKWTAYKFTKNVYDVWMPKHLARIHSIIDNLSPDLESEVPSLSEATGLSQGLKGSHLSQQHTEPEPLFEESCSQADIANQDVTPSTSFTTLKKSKRPKKTVPKRKV